MLKMSQSAPLHMYGSQMFSLLAEVEIHAALINLH